MSVYLPLALPDELLFSRLIRYRLLYGLTTRQLQLRLFNNDRICCHPLLPQCLPHLFDLHVSRENVAFNQTMAPIFQMGLPFSRMSLMQRLVSDKTQLISRLCQLPNNRGRQTQILKSCGHCAKEDLLEFGVSYWHRVHQMPNVSVCYKHKKVLSSQIIPARFSLSTSLPSSFDCKNEVSTLNLQYAKFSSDILNTQCLKTKEQTVKFILSKLQNAGFLTIERQIRRQTLCHSFFSSIKTLIVDQQYFRPSSTDDYQYIKNLLCQNQYTHPGKLCVFLFWLSLQCSENQIVSSNASSYREKKITQEKSCVEILMQGKSLNETSKQLGKSRTYVKSIALRFNLTNRLKPKRIDHAMREKILKLASRGLHRKSIALDFGISDGSVELVISSSPKIVLKRKQIKFESLRRRCRVEIMRYLQHNPGAMRKDIFKSCNRAAHWLFRNDKEWLEETLPLAQAPTFIR